MEIKIFDSRITPEMVGYKTQGSAGIDLYAAIHDRLWVNPGETVRIPTGISIWIRSPDLAGFISLRSGFSKSLIIPNAPGVVDSDYQGEYLVKLYNPLERPTFIEPLERFAQLVVKPIYRVNVFEFVDEFSSKTERGENGFGSTNNQK